MFVSDCLSVGPTGHLAIGGVDTVELAHTYGTPLYVMDEAAIRSACRQYKESIDLFYEGNGIAAYASKAFCCKEICRIAKEEGMGIDVVSEGELYTAASVDFPPERIFYHGNNKTPPELVYAVSYGVGRIVVDNLTELEILNSIALSQKKKVSILLRVKPGIDAHTHNFIRTGQIDSKFGFAVETGEAMEAIRYALGHEGLDLKGVHCHIGSQIFDIEPFKLAAKVLLTLISDAKRETGHEMKEMNLGGGFGIKYTAENDPVPYMEYMKQVSEVVKKSCKELCLSMPFIAMEPGRSIVGPAGITLYTAGGIKKIPNVRTYVSIDGGMTDNPRYALYGSEYEVVVANKADAPRGDTITLAGRCCESGDLIGEHMPCQQPEVGDIIAVLATGAYNYSMASNYNRVPRPAVVMVKDGKARLVVKRETLEDITKNDL